MKKFLAVLTVVFLSVPVFAGTGWCLYILDGTSVGDLDAYVDSTILNTNPEGEEAWVNSILEPDVEWNIKDSDVSYEPVYADPSGTILETDVYAFMFDTSTEPAPEYYLIKNSTGVALFQNRELFDWAVFDVGAIEEDLNLGTEPFIISHVTRFGQASQVPEPTTMLLLGTGLLGLAGMRRKLKK